MIPCDYSNSCVSMMFRMAVPMLESSVFVQPRTLKRCNRIHSLHSLLSELDARITLHSDETFIAECI